MDAATGQYPGANLDYEGFPGFAHLSMLAARAEYRAMAEITAGELTRAWISLHSTSVTGSSGAKISALNKAMRDTSLPQIIQMAALHDALYGRAQILLDIPGHDLSTPLVLDKRTIARGSHIKLKTIEAIWTTPVAFNSLDPKAPDFYKPSSWYMLGQQVHSSRLLTVITRPLPNMLAPAFNFSGMSLSQLAEPTVNNWLRTRQSVSDLVANFSTIVLKTSMNQVLTGADDGTDLMARVDLFNATRSNRGIMLIDKDREEIVQLAVPLGELAELQGASQGHQCSVSRIPAIILTGISSNSSAGSLKVFWDYISGQQESYWRSPIDTVIKILQLSMWGEIDPDIGFSFTHLRQSNPKELAAIRTADCTAAGNYIDAGVVRPEEVREKIARDPESKYRGLGLLARKGPK